MAFEKFLKGRAAVGDAMISITRWGQLNINSTCFRKFFQDVNFAELYYDVTRRIIGIKPLKVKSADAFSIRKDRAGKSPTISAIAFLKNYNIQYKTTRAFTVEWNKKEDLLELSLK